MTRSQIYVVAAPIGDYMADFAVAGLRVIEKTTHLFLESDDEFAARLRERKVIKPHHVVLTFDDADACTRAAAEHIAAGTDFVILASSGIPGFVDPGWEICNWIYENDALDKVDMHPIGVSSALDGALALCGINIQMFTFGGHYPENYVLDDLTWVSPSFAVIFFVRGGAISDFVSAASASLVPRRMVLFKDIRKRGMATITVLHADKPRPVVKDDPQADYVVVMSM